MIRIRKANNNDLVFLSDKLRDADLLECVAHGLTPYDALKLGYDKADLCRVACVGENPIAIFGIEKDTGIIWLLGSDDISIFRKDFIKKSKQELNNLMEGCDEVSAYMHKDNVVHEKWLRWLGFTVEPYNQTFKLVKYTKE